MLIKTSRTAVLSLIVLNMSLMQESKLIAPLKTKPAPLNIGITRSTSAPKISSPLSNVMSINDPVELPRPACKCRSRPLLIDFARNKRPREPLQPLSSNLLPLKEEDDMQDKRNKTNEGTRWKWLSRSRSAPSIPSKKPLLQHQPPHSEGPSPSDMLDQSLNRSIAVPASARLRGHPPLSQDESAIWSWNRPNKTTKKPLKASHMPQQFDSSSSEDELPIAIPKRCVQGSALRTVNTSIPVSRSSVARTKSLENLASSQIKSPRFIPHPMSRSVSVPHVKLQPREVPIQRAKSQSSLANRGAPKSLSIRKDGRVVVQIHSGGRAVYQVYY